MKILTIIIIFYICSFSFHLLLDRELKIFLEGMQRFFQLLGYFLCSSSLCVHCIVSCFQGYHTDDFSAKKICKMPFLCTCMPHAALCCEQSWSEQDKMKII